MEWLLSNWSQESFTNFVKIFEVQIAIVIVLLAFLTKSFFARLIINIANKIRKKESNPKESEMFGPLKIMYVLVGVYLAVKILPVSGKMLVIMRSSFRVAVILFITQIINTTLIVKDSILFKKSPKRQVNETVNDFICKIIRIVIWLVSFYIIFSELGFDLSGLITGLGLGTVVISLAAQDTVKSLLSGFTILSDKPFIIGDWIEVGNYAGTVIDITFRSTRIKARDNTIITIPNSTITTEYVINWSKLKARRFDCTLTLDMSTSTEKLKKVIKEIKVIMCAKDYVKEDTVYVGFNSISAYSNDIKIFAYLKETEYVKYLKLEEDLNCEFLNVLEKEGVELAYPTETVHVRNIESRKDLG